MAKVVSVIQKDRRRDLRRCVSLDGLVNDGPVSVIDISASGVGAKILNTPGPLSVGNDGYEIEIVPKDSGDGAPAYFEVGTEATLKLLKDGEQILAVTIEIVRFEPDGDNLGARFINIADEQYRVIERLVTGRPIKK